MSEYGERHTVARMVGAPPGYVGYGESGELTEAVRRRPYQVVLFDEIEKAHPEVFNALLQVLDDGRLTDGHGRVVDFRNTLIILTSNVGTQFMQDGGLGFRALKGAAQAQAEEREARSRVDRAMRDTFRPEFLNRIDDVILFHALTLDELRQIVDLQVADLQTRTAAMNLNLALTDEARTWFAERGYDKTYGARPLKRLISRELETPISKLVLGGTAEPGATIVIDRDPEADALALRVEAPPAIPLPLDMDTPIDV